VHHDEETRKEQQQAGVDLLELFFGRHAGDEHHHARADEGAPRHGEAHKEGDEDAHHRE
jgi:hypothetical protein